MTARSDTVVAASWSPSGPFFDELAVGQTVDSAPRITLSAGHAAMHQAIVGDRLALALDAELSAAVTGDARPLAHPALVWDVAIGQSTAITQRVIANLFYRGLVLRRAPAIGDTLGTSVEVVALRQNRPKANRPATGMAVLRVRTTDQAGRAVLDFHRCAMLPLSAPDGVTDRDDEFDQIPSALPAAKLASAVRSWDLGAVGAELAWPGWRPGQTWRHAAGDVVSSAPELARLTLNVAAVHHDATVTGRRLVYGGHTIGIAAAQLSRTLPQLLTIVAWHGCDHTGPVYEGDTLTSEIRLEDLQPLPSAGALAHLRVLVTAHRSEGGPAVPVLDWRPVGVVGRPAAEGGGASAS